MAVDWTDPCARAIALREAYYKLLSGEMEESIRAKGPNAEDEVKYTKANLSALLADLRAAESECAALTGDTSATRRRAFRLGARRGSL